MDDVPINAIAMLILRHMAGSIAGAIILHGYGNGYTSEQIAGALALLGTVVFSFWQKQGQAIALAAAHRAYDDVVGRMARKPVVTRGIEGMPVPQPPAASVTKP